MGFVLYIGKNVTKSKSGADVINKRNIYMLRQIFGEKIDFVEPVAITYKDRFFLGISNKFLSAISQRLSNNNYTHVFISQSLYGRVALYIKKNHPHLKIITFCHNIEIDYARSYLKSSGIKAIPFFMAVKIWEKCGFLNSDKILTLNSRDSKRLKQIYHKEADTELPTSFIDQFDEQKARASILDNKMQIDFLFVGVAFFPNIQGVQWFIDNVLPHVDGYLYIVGQGMDNVPFKNLNDRTHILGYVEDLSEYYYRAKVVISPIFSGAGMKTKTAEALMYGKPVIGTTEAFEGYEIDNKCMQLANNANEFIEAINYISINKLDGPNINARKIFCKNHNTIELIDQLKKIL